MTPGGAQALWALLGRGASWRPTERSPSAWFGLLYGLWLEVSVKRYPKPDLQTGYYRTGSPSPSQPSSPLPLCLVRVSQLRGGQASRGQSQVAVLQNPSLTEWKGWARSSPLAPNKIRFRQGLSIDVLKALSEQSSMHNWAFKLCKVRLHRSPSAQEEDIKTGRGQLPPPDPGIHLA